ncbi:MAG TPA: hypothetical protein VEA60_14285 [Allosphingosinicella sp.]|nr:hypothetical protein [Allosphingosinicella sp.]
MSVESQAASPRPRPRVHWIVWLFALVGLAGILAFIFLVVMVGRVHQPYQPAKVAGTKAEETFTVGNIRRLPGTALLQMDIAASDGGGSAYSGGGERDVRNILLLDRRTGASRRILPDNRRHVRQSVFLPAEAEDEQPATGDELLPGDPDRGRQSSPAAYYLLQVAQLGNRDLEDVLVGRLADGEQAYVMTGIDGVDSTWMDSPTRLGLIVRERLGLYYRIVDIASLKVVESRRIVID